MNSKSRVFGLALVITGIASTLAKAQEPPKEPQPFTKSVGGLNLQLTPSEWRSAGDIRGAGVAGLQNDVMKAWPEVRAPAAGTLTFRGGAVMGQIRGGNEIVWVGGTSFVQIPTTQPDPREGLDLEPLTRVARRLMEARIAAINARSSYGPGHAAIGAAEQLEMDLQRYYDSSTKDLPVNLKVELAGRELAEVSRALTEAQIARINAEALYGPEHPTLLKLRKQEASVRELYQEKLAQVREINEKSKVRE